MKSRLFLATIVLCCIPGAALSDQPLADRLPADALLYVGWAGKNLPLDGSMAGQFLAEPEVESLVGMVKVLLDTEVREGPKKKLLTHGWTLAGIAWKRPIALSVIDVDASAGKPVPRAVLLIDLGQDLDAFKEKLQALLDVIAKEEEEFRFTDAEVGERKYKTLKIEGEVDVSYGYIDNMFFLALGRDVPKLLTEVTAEGSLKASKRFAECFKEVGGENEQLSFYVDVERVVKLAESMAPAPPGVAGTMPAGGPPSPRQVLETLGVDKLTSIAGSMRIVDRGMYTKVRLVTKKPHKGLLKLLTGTELDEKDLAHVPEDAIFAAACKVSVLDLYKEFVEVVGSLNPQAKEQLDSQLAEIDKELGISLTDDLLASLGETWVISSAPSHGGFLTGTLLSVEVSDEEKLAKALAKALAKVQELTENNEPEVRVESMKVGQTEVRFARISGLPAPVSPAWAIHEGRLYVALWPQVIQSAIEAGSTKPLTRNAAYAKLRAKVSNKASRLIYVNSPEILRRVYPLKLIFGTIGTSMLGEKLEAGKIPIWPMALSTLEKYTWAEITAASNDEGGITLESYGSGPSAALVGVPAAAGMLVPALFIARRDAQETTERAEMRGLGAALHIHARLRKGSLPDDLNVLVQKGYLDSDNQILQKIKSGEAVYLGKGGSINVGGRTILVYVKPEPGDDDTYILLASGSVQRISVEELEERVEESEKIWKGDDEKEEDF